MEWNVAVDDAVDKRLGGGVPNLGTVAGFVVISGILFAISTQNYLVFHTLAELFAVVVAFAVFVVAWFSRGWIGTSFLLMLGIGHLFVGFVDLAHTLSYNGMNLLKGLPFDATTRLWIGGRAIEAVAFLIAVARPQARFSLMAVVAGFGVAVVALFALVALDVFPVCLVQGQGLTPFKIGTEYVMIAVFLGSAALLRHRTAQIDPAVLSLMVNALVLKAGAELAFTLYIDPYGVANAIGHMLKIASYATFLRAIVEIGLKRPQAMIFGSIAREKAASDEARRHAVTLDAVLDASIDPVLMIDTEGRFRFLSRAAEDFFNVRAADLIGLRWREVGIPATVMQPCEVLVDRVRASGIPATEEFSVQCRSTGAACCLEAQVSPVRSGHMDGGGGVVVVIRDVTPRRTMEEDLRSSLEENRVLMLEVHHRVKNNLQIVSSILHMQSWRVSDPRVRAQFEDACGRILSLAKVHEMLYKEHNVASVDMVRYIRTLCDELFRMYGVRDDWVILRIEPGGLLLPLDRAVPLALIVHELVTNALKHAFGEGGGQLSIGIGATGPDEGRLVVSDDGKGIGAVDVNAPASSLGYRMVGVLVRQIQGQLAIRNEAGTTVEIVFPLSGAAAEIEPPALVI